MLTLPPASRVSAGYIEYTSYHDELCVLSAVGTAAVLTLADDLRRARPRESNGSVEMDMISPPCTIAHTPYPRLEPAFPMRIGPCLLCRRKHVPELLLATIDCPDDLYCVGEPQVVQERSTAPTANVVYPWALAVSEEWSLQRVVARIGWQEVGVC